MARVPHLFAAHATWSARTRWHRTAVALFFALTLALSVNGADAGLNWCRTDPIVNIGDPSSAVLVAGPQNATDLATGPIEVIITVPVGVPTNLIATDNGFGYGYTVSFAESDELQATESGTEVRVDVYVPATDGAMPVLVEFIPDNEDEATVLVAVEGTANSWVSLQALQSDSAEE